MSLGPGVGRLWWVARGHGFHSPSSMRAPARRICEAAGAWVLPAAAGAGAAGDPAKSAAAAWGAACALSSSLRSAHCTAAGMAQQQACGEGTWGSTDAASTGAPVSRHWLAVC